MKIIYNNSIPFPGYRAMMLFGIIFAREEYKPLSATVVNHERIHAYQMIECALVVLGVVLLAIICGASWWWLLAVIPSYYAMYILAWILAGFRYSKICFEIEAYTFQNDREYLSHRKPFKWLSYVFGAK